jgi:hypothetical protein
MDSVLKIAAGVCLGLTAFFAFQELLLRYELHQQLQEWNTQAKKMQADSDYAAVSRRQAADHATFVRDEQNRMRLLAQQQALQLVGNETCIAGTIMRANFVNGVHSVVQLLDGNYAPVRCHGDHRLVLPR